MIAPFDVVIVRPVVLVGSDVLVTFYLQAAIPVSEIAKALQSDNGQQLLTEAGFRLAVTTVIPTPTTQGESDDSDLTTGQLAAIVSVIVVVVFLSTILVILWCFL